jgi:hypothetical protein
MIEPIIKSSTSFNMTEKGNDREVRVVKKGANGAIFDEMFNRELASLDKYGTNH